MRTALFNYLFARAHNGRFILRIEDTDQERFQEDALEDIYRTFDWLGFHWDEGPDIDGPYAPYLQSQRSEIYRKYAGQLVAQGNAYYCYCSPERLEELRQGGPEVPGVPGGTKSPGYDRRCRNLCAQEQAEFAGRGLTRVIRFKVPLEGSTAFYDELLGNIETANRDINPDPVLLKSDGLPTYHLANVIDDHLMEISHILRAQEWLPSCSLHTLIYQALEWTPPKFCHLPMVLGEDGQKLSKRHGATRIMEFREQGYLPEALINYVALLGWSFDDSREFFTLKELESVFSLEKLNKAPGVFDYKKLAWFDGNYIRKLPPDKLIKLLLPYLQQDGLVQDDPSPEQMELLSGLVPLVQERLTTLSGVSGLVGFLFKEIEEYNIEDLIPKKLDKEKTLEVLKNVEQILKGFFDHSDEENEKIFRDLAKEMGIKLGAVLLPLRVALTGSRISPPLFESIRLLGQTKTLKRIERVIKLF
ncbi:Glutamate--tRNA ligase [subsurface metagenome]